MTTRLYRIIAIITCLLIFNACATYNAQYKNEEDKFNELPNKEVEQTFYLIGDAGKSPQDGMSTALSIFNKYTADKDTKDAYTIFLGDNIYPAGMPAEGEKGRAAAENSINAQFRSLSNFKGNVVFIPGNHDWYANGLKGLKEEEKFIEAALGDDTFQPENGCPLEDFDIGDHVKLIVIDTQWYLEDWNKHPTINTDCEIKTRERFFEELEGEFKKAQNRTIIVAMHHPMLTNGVHGGKFALSKHLFPTQKNIPVPIIASLITQIRTQGGVSIQDRYNESYNNLMNRIETLAFDKKNIVFVSGHEHTLQYNVKENIKQIVSGGGAKESYVTLSKTGLFGYGREGFAELKIYKDGSTWVTYYGEENGLPKKLFVKQVLTPEEDFDISTLPDSFPQEVETSVYTKEQTEKTDFFKSVWGGHYRDAYSQKVKVKVATLDTLYGGLEIMRRGGGHQTRTLRLRTEGGQQLNMRALKKSATQYLQSVLFKDSFIEDKFAQTEIEGLIFDFYTAAHPYAFALVPDLAKAAGIFHTHPKLYFIPKHKYLGNYNKDYGGELYMIEERPEKHYKGKRNFGYPDDIESTYDIIDKIRRDEKYKIDEDVFIKARLFDMLIGDWDRHQDQWRWAQFDQENGDKVYSAIPRDRDQVFTNFDGSLLDVMRVLVGPSKQLQVYDKELKNIKWMNAAGIKLDRVLIQNATRDQWIKHAKFLQEHITSAVIDTAFSKVPKEVQDETLQEIKENLIGRKANLVDIANRYYDYLNELVILAGTDKDDYIEVTRVGDKETHVKISRIKGGKKADVIVDRTFNRDVTKEIWIYGLDDKDVFEVSGKAKHKIFVRLIGGQDNDTYIIKEGRRVKIYDHKSEKNTIQEKKGGTTRFTDIYKLNLFDYTKNIHRTYITTPSFGYNPDDGISLGLSFVATKFGFHRNPFSQQHRFKGGFFFATNSFILDYEAEFANIKEDWNLQVGGTFTSANFTNNFFGYGNETVNQDDELDRDYNRVRTSIYKASVGLFRKGNFGSNYGFKAFFEGIGIEETEDRFITDFVPAANGEFYKRRFYGGLEAKYFYESYDKKLNPTRGMTFLLELGGKTGFEGSDSTFGYINADLGLYSAISKNRKLVLKTDVRSQFRIGNDIVFYQASNLGGSTGLRGYRDQRFTGQNSFVGSTDLRYSFNSFKTNVLPLQIGVFGGFDVGRVWLKGESSHKWHNDYGGGVWVTAAESLSGTFNLFNSTDGLRFSFAFGLNF